MSNEISINGVLTKLNVSKSGYYDWLNRVPSNQEIRKQEVILEIKKTHLESFEIYGSPKITIMLNRMGLDVSQKTVANYMRESGLKARYVRKPSYKPLLEGFNAKLNNILVREFNPSSPNEMWCTDITYIWTKNGFVYLTSIMDLYSRKIISWKLSDSLSTDAVIECVNEAISRRGISNPVVIHSDRGSQYVSKRYYDAIRGNLIPSYSRKGNPWDNACIESFHALIKREWINFYKITDINHAKSIVFEYIETFYNTIRIHGACGYLSPTKFETEVNNALNH